MSIGVKENNEVISIIVPVYNAHNYIKETVNSVLNQTYSEFELILIDDGSTDDSIEIIKAFDDKRIVLLQNDKKGAYAARNFGIKNAKGRYIAFLDADDVWNNSKLQKTYDFMKANDAGFVFTAYEFGDEEAKPTGKIVHVPKMLPYKKALSRTIIFTSTVLIDLTKVNKELVYMPHIASEDTATWWNILRSGVIAYGLDENLTIYRRSSNTLSSNKIVAVKRIWNLYRKNEHMNVFESFIHFIGWGFRAVARRL